MLIVWFINSFFHNFFEEYLYFCFTSIYIFIMIIHQRSRKIQKYLNNVSINNMFKIITKHLLNSIFKSSNVFNFLLSKNNIFFKEGFYIDLLQKLSFDLWIKNFIYISTQLFNLNYLNNFIIKFIINFIIYFFNNLLTNEDNINLIQILSNILIMFLLIWHIIFIVYLNIYILSIL